MIFRYVILHEIQLESELGPNEGSLSYKIYLK